MIKAIIVDDEKPMLREMETLLVESGLAQIAGTFANPLDALEFARLHTVDAVFLDIEMPEMDGMELASSILGVQPGVCVVFVTAYNKYAVEAFQLNALDYLMKPVAADRLQKTLEKIGGEKMRSKRYDGVKIKCFGRFAVISETEEVKFRTEKAEELLAFIIDKRGGFVSRSEILDSLWSDFDGDRALVNFNTTLHYLKKALLQYGVNISLTFDRGGYKFNLGSLDCDYLRFYALIENNVQQSIAEFEKAAGLFTSEYLAGWEYDWVTIKRLLLTEKYLSLTLRLAEHYQEIGDFRQANQWLKAGLLKEPLHREMNFRLMEALTQANEHALAAKYFAIYRNGLKKKLGQEPDEAILALFR